MKRLTSILIAALFLSNYALAKSTETRQLDDFRTVAVGESIEVVLMSGSENTARIETNGVEAGDVQTRVSGDKLVIGMSSGNKWFNNVNVKIWLTYKSLEGISVSSSASITNEGVIKADRLVCKASSSGSAELNIEVRSLEAEVSSSGRLSLAGTSIEQQVSVSSSGTYHAYELSSETCEAKASSSGNARISVANELIATASSSGSIRYKGDPEKLITNSNSSGSVKKG